MIFSAPGAYSAPAGNRKSICVSISKKTVFISRLLSALFRRALRAPGSNRHATHRDAQTNCGTVRAAAKDIRPHDSEPPQRSAAARLIALRALPDAAALPHASVRRDTKGTRSNGPAGREFDNGKPVWTLAVCACLRSILQCSGGCRSLRV